MHERSRYIGLASSSCRRVLDNPREGRKDNGAAPLREDSVSIPTALFFRIRGATAEPGRMKMKTGHSYIDFYTNRQFPVLLICVRIDDSARVSTLGLILWNVSLENRPMVTQVDLDIVYGRYRRIERD
jgi:plasmid stabilization system protein ParE